MPARRPVRALPRDLAPTPPRAARGRHRRPAQRAQLDAAPRPAERRRAPAHRRSTADAAPDPARAARGQRAPRARRGALRGARRWRPPAPRRRHALPTATCWSAPTASARRCGPSGSPTSRSSRRRRRPRRCSGARRAIVDELPDVLLDGFVHRDRPSAAACCARRRSTRAARSPRPRRELAPDVALEPVEPYMMVSCSVLPGTVVPPAREWTAETAPRLRDSMSRSWRTGTRRCAGSSSGSSSDDAVLDPVRPPRPAAAVGAVARDADRRRDPRDAADARHGRQPGAARRRRCARGSRRGGPTWWRRSAPTRTRCATSSTRSCGWPPSTTSASAAAGSARAAGMPRLLGLGCGQPGRQRRDPAQGRAEAAEAGAAVELVRLDDLRLPTDPTRPSPTTRGGSGSGSWSATG